MPESIQVSCPICNGTSSQFLFWNEDYISNKKFEIVKCSQCGLARSVLEDAHHPESYYPPEYYRDGDSAFHPVFERAARAFRANRAWMIHHSVGRPGRILDIGCGSGSMLISLAKKGWECFGTEMSEVSAKRARRNGGIHIKVTDDIRSCGFEEGFFDVVSLWHVLEHIDNLDSALREVRRILKPDGLLFVEVPNFSSLQSIWGKGKWFHLDAPRHIYHFDSQTLRQVLKNYGFDLVKMQTSSFEMGPFGILQTAFNQITGTQNFFYSVLMRKGFRRGVPSDARKRFFSHLLLLPIFLPLSFILEAVAGCLHQGSVLRTVSRKT